ncbi:nuclear transport factor 2 family protein [Candidatus Kapabacteria bacterium]|nr:nuclear transport factor 2 family protein [Candidatus Kapabacteria bacterium]
MKILLILFFTISSFAKTPEEIVNLSMKAYNNHKFEEFMGLFSDNVQMYSFDCSLTANGKVEAKKVYKRLFDKSPNLHSKILNRTIVGNKVIDHEEITGRYGSDKKIEIVFIYVIENDKIVKTMLIKP